MDKISGIVPASARTQVAESAAAQPARPGAPLLGRPEGRNSLGDRVTLSKKLEEMKQSGQLPEPDAPATYKKPGQSKTKTIEDMNQQFFTNPKTIAREGDATHSEEILANMEENGFTPPIAPRESHAPPMNRVETPL